MVARRFTGRCRGAVIAIERSGLYAILVGIGDWLLILSPSRYILRRYHTMGVTHKFTPNSPGRGIEHHYYLE